MSKRGSSKGEGFSPFAKKGASHVREKQVSRGLFGLTEKAPTAPRKIGKASGKSCKARQMHVQEQIRLLVEPTLESDQCLSKESIMMQIGGAGPNSVCYGMAKVFPGVVCRKGVYQGYRLKGVTRQDETRGRPTATLQEAIAIVNRTPTLLSVVHAATSVETRKKIKRDKYPSTLTAMSKILFIANQEMNAIQKIVGIQLRLSGVPKKTITNMNACGDSVSYKTTTTLLDRYAAEVDKLAAEWSGCDVSQVGDNVDLRAKTRYESAGDSTLDCHFYNNMLTKSRIDMSSLNDEKPTLPEVFTVDHCQQLIPSVADTEQLVDDLIPLVAKYLAPRDPKYDECAKREPHRYAEEMLKKTEIIHLGVIEKNESKAGDMIDIMSYCKKYPAPDHGKKMVYRGDYLTYERAKVSVAAMNSSGESNLNTFIPAFADFHLQMAWSQLIADKLWVDASITDIGTIMQIKSLISANQAKKDVKNSYYAVSHLFNKLLTVYLEIAQKDVLTNSALSARTSVKEFLKTIFQTTSYPKLTGFKCTVCGKKGRSSVLIDKHMKKKHPTTCTSSTTPPGSSASTGDEVVDYTYYLLRLLLLKANMDEAIQLGDGERLMLTIKHMYLYFRVNGNTKYALACFELMASLEYFVSQKTAVSLLQDRFINLRASKDSNYPVDLLVEHNNKVFKDNFHLYRGAATQQALDRFSKSQTQTSEIMNNYCKEFGKPQFIGRHKANEEKLQRDINLIIKSITPMQVFTPKNRRLKCKTLDTTDALLTLDIPKLTDWMHQTITGMRTHTYLK